MSRIDQCDHIVIDKIDFPDGEIQWLASVVGETDEGGRGETQWIDSKSMLSPEAAAYRAKRWLQGKPVTDKTATRKDK